MGLFIIFFILFVNLDQPSLWVLNVLIEHWTSLEIILIFLSKLLHEFPFTTTVIVGFGSFLQVTDSFWVCARRKSSLFLVLILLIVVFSSVTFSGILTIFIFKDRLCETQELKPGKWVKKEEKKHDKNGSWCRLTMSIILLFLLCRCCSRRSVHSLSSTFDGLIFLLLLYEILQKNLSWLWIYKCIKMCNLINIDLLYLWSGIVVYSIPSESSNKVFILSKELSSLNNEPLVQVLNGPGVIHEALLQFYA